MDEQLAQALAERNGHALADAIRALLDGEPARPVAAPHMHLAPDVDIAAWSDVCRAATQRGTLPLERADATCAAVVRAAGDSGGWVVPAILFAVRRVVFLAGCRRAARYAGGLAPEDVARTVSRALAVCMTHRAQGGDDGRACASLGVAAALMRLYAAIGQPALVANVLRAVCAASRGLPGLVRVLAAVGAVPEGAERAPKSRKVCVAPLFPRGHVASFALGTGRHALLSGDHSRALRALLVAADICVSALCGANTPAGRTAAARRMRAVAERAVPLLLLESHGRRAPHALLVAHASPESLELLSSVRTGDPARLAALVCLHRASLLRKGTLAAWEALVSAAYYRLLVLLWRARSRGGDVPSRVPIALVAALAHTDADVAALHVAALVRLRVVRGYLSESHSMLVLSQSAPFS